MPRTSSELILLVLGREKRKISPSSRIRRGRESKLELNTTNTDKSMESIKEQITPSTSRKRRRTKSGEARRIPLDVPENIL